MMGQSIGRVRRRCKIVLPLGDVRAEGREKFKKVRFEFVVLGDEFRYGTFQMDGPTQTHSKINGQPPERGTDAGDFTVRTQPILGDDARHRVACRVGQSGQVPRRRGVNFVHEIIQ